MRKINKHTAWIKWYVMRDMIHDKDYINNFQKKYKLSEQEPRPKLEKYRGDIYYRGKDCYYVWHISRPRISFHWPLRWPIRFTFNIIKTRYDR